MTLDSLTLKMRISLMAHVTHKNVTCLDMFEYRTIQIDSVQKKMEKKRFIKILMVRYVCLSSKLGMLDFLQLILNEYSLNLSCGLFLLNKHLFVDSVFGRCIFSISLYLCIYLMLFCTVHSKLKVF